MAETPDIHQNYQQQQQQIRSPTGSQRTPPQLPTNNHHNHHHQHPLSQSHTPPTPISQTISGESHNSSPNGANHVRDQQQSWQQRVSPASPNNLPNISGVAHAHEPSAFVRPSDLLRPRPTPKAVSQPKPDRPIDRDERAGLKAIREFLRVRNCYEVLPLSFRLIELDVGLTVKESLNILMQCGELPQFGL